MRNYLGLEAFLTLPCISYFADKGQRLYKLIPSLDEVGELANPECKIHEAIRKSSSKHIIQWLSKVGTSLGGSPGFWILMLEL